MKLTHALLLAVPVVALALTDARDAAACGGCFVPPDESTQVTGHRMMLSVSPTETTLWDQISYSGNPSSFAWILPTKGIVEIGLSSDALFAFVGQSTAVNVYPPPLNCPPPPPNCLFDGEGSAAGAGGGSADGGVGGVEVVAQETVGPYETVQLKSNDPAALKNWLTSHNFNVPADVQPIVDAYVADHFDFLALKLVPGKGLDAMRPVRVTSPGASPTLPLRMVAAGTGAITPITLWVLGEGRYETANFSNFTINPSSVIWNWATQESNYKTLRDASIKSSGGQGWLTESARPTSPYDLTNSLLQVAEIMPLLSGYGDAMGMGAVAEAQADVDKLTGKINASSLWISRLHAELPRAALGKDLEVGASAAQTEVSNTIQTTLAVGTPPPCPDYSWCSSTVTTGVTTGGSGGSGGDSSGGSGGSGSSSSGGCGIGVGHAGDTSTALGGLGVLAALSLLRRRRQR